MKRHIFAGVIFFLLCGCTRSDHVNKPSVDNVIVGIEFLDDKLEMSAYLSDTWLLGTVKDLRSEVFYPLEQHNVNYRKIEGELIANVQKIALPFDKNARVFPGQCYYVSIYTEDSVKCYVFYDKESQEYKNSNAVVQKNADHLYALVAGFLAPQLFTRGK